MRKPLIGALLTVGALLGAQRLAAQQQPQQEDALGRYLYPPELVMQHQEAIALTEEQRSAITVALHNLQQRIVEVQWQMAAQTEKLNGLLAGPSVDRAAVLAQFDQVLDLERAVKRAHLEALVLIKNTLTPEQQRELDLRRARPRGPSPR